MHLVHMQHKMYHCFQCSTTKLHTLAVIIVTLPELVPVPDLDVTAMDPPKLDVPMPPVTNKAPPVKPIGFKSQMIMMSPPDPEADNLLTNEGY